MTHHHSAERNTVDAYLKTLDAKLGLGFLELNEEGVCALEFEGKGRLRIEVPEGSVHCYLAAPLVHVPADETLRLALYNQAMNMNFMGQHTDNATLSVNARTQTLTLHYVHPVADLDATILENLIDNFLETAVSVKARFESQPAPSNDAPTTHSAPGIDQPSDRMMGHFV